MVEKIMLDVSNVNFNYKFENHNVLDKCNLELKKGEVGCILGQNGVGKSTLLKCITGLLNYDGNVKVANKEISQINPKERSKLITYSAQEFSINFNYSVFEILLMGRNPYVNFFNGPTAEDEELVYKTLNKLQIEHLANKSFLSLSGGQKRLVMIARALIQDSKVMIFDEPTSFLDFKNQVLILDVIKKISKEYEKTILFSLHDPNLTHFSDKIFTMKNGTIVNSGGQDLLNKDTFMDIYGLSTDILQYNNKKIVIPNI
ncbi:ABC transporter ATP-binding protein [Methanococcus voltae]|uniref:Iron complex transport system ATP-binding protein n=2 Tax=Methanococcus voltae TaxID=2188 RepID=A0A8J7UUU7_METVO|nr:ABC transporter ATP-binding protein [Methanococcus voltae]MBP2172884.1 iron complex transport system ATP-binding protein [Methanococcus voltae]MBP2201706.1 iron complex transport system ATP-binding protein [Methanococcus voltae]MCS3922494.1 iron complex transport system ATP-binding protein [Methanococcus voltae PS]